MSSGEYRDMLVTPFPACEQCPENHLSMRSLAGSACGNVAYADGRSLASMHLEYPAVIQGMPYFQGEVIWC